MTTGPQNAVPFGKYLLLKRLAVGGMAELYLAKDPQNDRLVVIKRILPYLAQETEFVRMFLDEARIAAQLHHPHIITMHELGHLEGSIFIAMEFVEGVDLRKILQQEVKRQMFVPPDIAAWLTSRLCEGLHYAHNRNGPDGKPLGIIHRDVSPQNLMVGFDGEVKLVDFGIAKATSFMERSKPGVIKGKFLYLSPEQLSQERIDHRADLFAIGTMLYEVTTGKSPFYKPTTEAVIYAIRAEDPPPPHLTMSGYPVELSRIIMRCLIKDRSKRYQQAGEIHADLESWMRKESPTTMATVVDYVDKLFGDQQERTSIFIPPNARSERTRVEGKRVSSDSLPTGSGQNAIPRTQSSDAVASSDSPTGSGLQPVGGRTRTGENVPTGSGLSAIPARTNSNPTMPLGPFKSISDETTKPIATGLSERHSPEGRRPTPSPDSIPAITEDRRTVPIRGSEIRAAQKNPSIVTAPETRAVTDRRSGHNHASLDQEHTANTSPVALAQRNFEEMEVTAISHSGRLHTGESLVELTPSAPQPSQPSQPATPPPPPAPIKRSRDFPVYPERLPPPVSDSKMPIAEPATMAGRPSNVRQPVPLPSAPPPNTDPSSAANPIPKARSPGDTFADDDVSSFDPEDEQSTMDFRDSALDNLKLQLRRDSKYMIEAADSLFTRKPWLIAVFAFLGVLILGLILIISTRPEKKTVTPIIAHSTVDPVSGETVLPEAPSSELPESGKTMVRFAAPAGTQIVHDGSLFRPNKAYPLFPGSFTLRYQCPRKGKAAGDSINYTVNVDRYRSEPQVVSLKCN